MLKVPAVSRTHQCGNAVILKINSSSSTVQTVVSTYITHTVKSLLFIVKRTGRIDKINSPAADRTGAFKQGGAGLQGHMGTKLNKLIA